MRRLIAGIVGVSAFLFAASMLVAPQVGASAYGESQYGICKFERRCPPKNTVAETKAGLQVAVNLVDGQQIARGEYEVKVTPLNGDGRSFKYVEFYVDGVLVSTFYPDETGTAVWSWDTNRYAGTNIKVLIYDTDDSVLTQQFTVRILEPGQQPSEEGIDPSLLPGTAGGQGNDNVIAQFFAFLEASVRVIPTPLALSIPLVLLLVMLVIILLLYMQSRREAAEIRRQQLALARARQLAEEKDGFIELVSHYLRTPLTLIRGGMDYIGSMPIGAGILAALTNAVSVFGDSIERLVGGIADDPRLATIPSVPDVGKPPRVWTAPQFWVPVASIGLVLALMDYVLLRAGKLDGSFIALATQVGLYVASIIALYAVLRWRQLQARDKAQNQLQEQQQAAIDEARNELIREAAATLALKLDAIHSAMAGVPESQGKSFMNEGYARIAEVLRRFRATATVVPPVTAMPFVQFTLESLVSQAEKQVAQAAEAKRIIFVGGTGDVTLASPQPAWLVQVLASVLDNAIAYSPEGSQIEIGGQVEQGIAVLYVRDHGEGIPEAKLAELFQPFSKAEGAMKFDHPGIGLSLYLDRLLVTNLGGSIHIESSPGSGTTVHIAFPVR
ncbi:MAG TPA: ATP-binding protein [Candidatus Saccharimonadales bacterium]|nr:ATP-binding protein [Candidatus Saccharimonadales bacterium]